MSYEATKNRIFDRAELGLTQNFSEINAQVLSNLERILERLDISSGNIADSERNRRIRGEINGIVKAAVNQSDYTNKVNAYLKNFDDLAKENTLFHTNVNKLSGVGTTINKAKRSVLNLTVKQLKGQGMDRAFTIPVSDALEQYITSGTSKKHVENALKTFIKGQDGKSGLLERHAQQISRDAIMQYDGNVQRKVQEEYKLNSIAYIGSLIEDSRPQCIRWVNQFGGVIPLDQLEREIDWAQTNGTGWITGTTEETFLSHRGGYNCRHIATPINV